MPDGTLVALKVGITDPQQEAEQCMDLVEHLAEHPEQYHSKFQRISILQRRKSPDEIGLNCLGKQSS